MFFDWLRNKRLPWHPPLDRCVFLNFELFLFIVKELTVPYFQVFDERVVKVALTSTIINNCPLMVSEDQRWKGKPGINRFYGAYAVTWPAAMQIYWNKRKCLRKKRVELPQDWFVTRDMAAVSLFCNTNMAVISSDCEYDLYLTLVCCLLFDC